MAQPAVTISEKPKSPEIVIALVAPVGTPLSNAQHQGSIINDDRPFHARVKCAVVFNVDYAEPNADIFAVPTYTLDGKIAFLGNP